MVMARFFMVTTALVLSGLLERVEDGVLAGQRGVLGARRPPLQGRRDHLHGAVQGQDDHPGDEAMANNNVY